jgi:uncharacterized RDD family membrane protein YckC
MNHSKTKTNLPKRFIAGLVDYTIIVSFLYAFAYSFGSRNEDGSYSVNGFPALIPVLFWFLFTVVLEACYGATVGNSIVGLKPRSLTKNNGELSIGQSLKRHLLDPLDMFPFGIIGIITIKNTDKNQRLGDIWAKTIVIESTENEN